MELAYTSNKADTLQIEQTSWVGGPSLEILAKYLDQAASESYIPYGPPLGQYITKEEADRDLVEKIGGSIGCQSSSGHGATFYLRLPVFREDPGDLE